MVSKIETSIIKATGFKVPDHGYLERQDYLAALIRAVAKLSDAKYDDLTDDNDVLVWVLKGTKALNAKQEIDDFTDDLEGEEADDESAEGTEDDEAEEAEAEAATQEADEAPEDEEPEPKPHVIKEGRPRNPPKPKLTKAEKEAAAAAEAKKAPPKGTKLVTRYDNLDPKNKNRYGVVVGTKTDDAIKMYERGTTSVEIQKELGGRYYNILRTLTEAGHLVERDGNGIFKLTHKDDLTEKQKVVAKQSTAKRQKVKQVLDRVYRKRA